MSRTAWMLLLSLAAAGCHDHAFMSADGAPRPASGAVTRASADGGAGYVASAELLPRSTGGHLLDTDLGMPAAPSTGWVEVTFGGVISVQTSSATAAECTRWWTEFNRRFFLCAPPLDGVSVPPEGVYRCRISSPGGCGQTLFIEMVCGYQSCVAPYLPSPGTTLGNVVFLREGTTVTAARQGEIEGWGNSFTPHQHAYTYGGAHTMEVRQVAAPFAVESSDGRFAVERNRQILLSSTAAQTFRWVFVAGDTAAEPLYPLGLDAAPAYPACDFRAECRWLVRAEGRMYVRGRGESSGNGWVASPVIRFESKAAELNLACGTARGSNLAIELTRGDVFDCAVSVDPEQSFSVVEWTFHGSNTVPAAGEEPYTGRRWVGEMVTQGNVTVTARVGERTLTATVQVEVRPRPWVDRIQAPTIKHFRCEEPLTSLCPLPVTPVYFHDLGRLDTGPQFSPRSFAFIRSGPNAGYGYIPGESFVDVREPWVSLNGILQSPSDNFWRERRECDVSGVYRWVMDHEMLHYEGMRQFVEDQPTRGWMESLAPFGSQEQVDAAFRKAMQDFGLARSQAGDAGHTNPRFTNPPCDVELNTGTRDPRIPGRDLRF